MTKTIRMNNPLVTQPLKTSPATGATLASLGFENSVPLLHGSQGCSAFSKVYLIQHLREPIPLQNTAVDQVAAVMGGDNNLHEAMKRLCEKESPELLTVMTTGLTEMQGSDIVRVILDFKKAHPEHDSTRIVGMNTPDFIGSMQSGFAHAVDCIVRQLVQPPTTVVRQRKQVNVLCSVGMTSRDIELVSCYLDAFNMNAIIVPNLSLSLDGHLSAADYSPTSTGGTAILEIEGMSESVMTFVIGESMLATAKWLKNRFDIPYFYSDMGMGIESMDHLVTQLKALSGVEVPKWIDRARQRLQDAMLDCHFILGNEPVALGLEPDLAIGYSQLLNSVGMDVIRVVTTLDTKGLSQIEAKEIVIGDLSMLKPESYPLCAIVSNTHAAHIVEPDIPVLRAGYPCHDQFGNMDVTQFGYEGARERIFALANLVLRNHKDEVPMHISAYRFSADEVIQRDTAC